MEIIGIICEYNPFHNGHIYHIKKIKDMYPDSLIILVLNGYFLERGEISILTKEDKTKIALENDIDIVLELPVIFGTQSADTFANSAITILNNLGVKKLIFGSETNDINLLTEIANDAMSDSYEERIKELLNTGINYPTALSKALNTKTNFNNPNDLLGVSYIKAIKKNNFLIEPISIKRTSNYHDLTSNSNVISASNIRSKLKNNEDISQFLKSSVEDKIIVPNNELLFNLLKTKILTTPHLEDFLDVDEGIHNRLVNAAVKSNNVDELIKNIKTKRYTYNKINRMLIHILLGITKDDVKTAILDYVRILGFNENGQKYLNKIKKDTTIPLQINKESLIYKYEIIASIIYDLICNTNTYNFEIKKQPIKK